MTDINHNDYEDGVKYNISSEKYFMIFEYDIRIFNNKRKQILEINTYPNDPRKLLECICRIV